MNIPKKIHLTCKDKNNIDNPKWLECLNKYKEMYPDYEIIIYDNDDIYNIIEKMYPEYLEKIKQITIGAVLADVFRYLILYLEGGIYSDMDCEPIKRIDDLLNNNFTYYHGCELRDNNFYIYKNNINLIDKRWDSYNNKCNNSNLILNGDKFDTYKCMGHNIGNPSTILGYEWHKDWYNMIIHKDIWCYKNVGICQWFIITESNQDIFLKMFLYCMGKLDILINLDKNKPSFHYDVINNCGPLGFTKIVLDNLTDKICILPCEFFCTNWNVVPITRNSYIKHLFTGTWLIK